jgi:gamma-tubulin complex component 3
MAPNKDNRIVDAVDRLIGHLIPTDPNEEEEVATERHDNCFELVRTILERFVTPSGPPAMTTRRIWAEEPICY